MLKVAATRSTSVAGCFYSGPSPISVRRLCGNSSVMWSRIAERRPSLLLSRVVEQKRPGSPLLSNCRRRLHRPMRKIVASVDIGRDQFCLSTGKMRQFVADIQPKAYVGDIIRCQLKITQIGARRMLVAKVQEFIQEYNYMCGVIVEEEQDFLLPHRYPSSTRIPVVSFKKPRAHTTNSVYLCRLDRTNQTVRVVRYLGENADPETQMKCVYTVMGHGGTLSDVYTSEDYTSKLHEGEDTQFVSCAGRREFEDSVVFAIDPHDVKDSDDAISIKRLDETTFEVGVHISDLTHFLKQDMSLLRTLYFRGSTCYLPTSCHPMLPRSFGVHRCSLVPNATRPTFSALFTIKDGKVVDHWLGRGVVKSRYLFSYFQAELLLDLNAQDLSEHNKSLQPGKQVSPELLRALQDAYEISKVLRTHRMKKYRSMVLNFNDPAEFAESGLDQKEREAVRSYQLIEEFMLLANRTVAEFLVKNEKKAIVRIHPIPEGGQEVRVLHKNLLDCVPERHRGFVDYIVLRHLTRACYAITSETVTGYHFSLDFPNYTHFTSPIRRSSDVFVHFQLAKALYGEPLPECMLENPWLMTSICNIRAVMHKTAENVARNVLLHLYLTQNQSHYVTGLYHKGTVKLADYTVSVPCARGAIYLKDFDVARFKLVPTENCGFLDVQADPEEILENLFEDYFRKSEHFAKINRMLSMT